MNKGELDQFQAGLEISDGPVEESGFWENASAAFDVFVDEETSVSEYLNTGAYDERDMYIDSLIHTGQIPEEDYLPYSSGSDLDYGRMAYDLKRKGYDIQDDYDVRGGIRAELEAQRNAAMEIHSRAGFAGSAGIFLGQMAAAQVDPVNIGAMFIPGLAAIRTGTLMARTARAAMYYGATSAASEGVIQAGWVMDWKEKIGVEYKASDGLVAVGIAGLGGAVLGTGIDIGAQEITRGFRKLRQQIKDREPREVAEPLLQEIEQAEYQYDQHVQAYRRQQLRLRLDRLKEESKWIRAHREKLAEERVDDVLMRIDDEQEFLEELESRGTAPKLDEPIDFELERSVRESEKMIETRAEESREELFRQLQEEADMLRDNPQEKWRRMSEHNKRRREDAVYLIDTETDIQQLNTMESEYLRAMIRRFDEDQKAQVLDEEDPIGATYDIATSRGDTFNKYFGIEEEVEPPKLKLVETARPEEPTGLDAETDAVAESMAASDAIEEASIINDETPEIFAEFDEDNFMEMSQAERDQYIQDMLGDEAIEDLEVEYETGQIDGDGNPMYESKRVEDIRADMDEQESALHDFIDCWNGSDGET